MKNKPITPIVDADGMNYLVNAILDARSPELPTMVNTHIRHLLIAAELGDLVIVQCVRESDNTHCFVLCAYVLDKQRVCKMLPICELPTHNDLMAGRRPPQMIAKTAFVKASNDANMHIDVIECADGSAMLGELDSIDAAVGYTQYSDGGEGGKTH